MLSTQLYGTPSCYYPAPASFYYTFPDPNTTLRNFQSMRHSSPYWRPYQTPTSWDWTPSAMRPAFSQVALDWMHYIPNPPPMIAKPLPSTSVLALPDPYDFTSPSSSSIEHAGSSCLVRSVSPKPEELDDDSHLNHQLVQCDEVTSEMYSTTNPLSPSPREFACEHSGCLKRYTKFSHLKAHYRTHTGRSALAAIKNGKMNDPICGERFLRSDQLTRHRRKEHDTEPRFKCPICSKTFLRSDNCQVHVSRHTMHSIQLSVNGRKYRPRTKQIKVAFRSSLSNSFSVPVNNNEMTSVVSTAHGPFPSQCGLGYNPMNTPRLCCGHCNCCNNHHNIRESYRCAYTALGPIQDPIVQLGDT